MEKKDTKDHWYNVIENLIKKGVSEEVGLGIKNFGYITSLAFIRDDEIPVMILGLYGESVGEEVVLSKELTDYKWVTLEEAKQYDLIGGIYGGLEILDAKLRTGESSKWSSQGGY